jgi:hypothetical protein
MLPLDMFLFRYFSAESGEGFVNAHVLIAQYEARLRPVKLHVPRKTPSHTAQMAYIYASQFLKATAERSLEDNLRRFDLNMRTSVLKT